MVRIHSNGVRLQNRIPESEMNRRWAAAVKVMEANGIDGLIMQANDSMLCTYTRWFTELRNAHYNYTLFGKDGGVSIIGHGGEGGALFGPDFPLKLKDNMTAPVFNNNKAGNAVASGKMADLINKYGYKKIGVLGMNLLTAAFYNNLVAALPGCEFVDFSDEIDQIIAVKSAEEYVAIAESLELHDTIVDAIPSLVYVGRPEREFSMDLYRLAMILGGDDYLNNLFVGTKNGTPGGMYCQHYNNKLMEEGDILNVLVEVPCSNGFYCDLHRYWSIGEPKAEVLEAFELSNQAQDYMASICKPGITGKEVFKLVNEWFAGKGLGLETRMHGHGQGYGLIERPYFDNFDEMVLEEGMYVVLHPTIKYKGFAIAPGSNYVIEKDGARLLSRAPRQLNIIK